MAMAAPALEESSTTITRSRMVISKANILLRFLFANEIANDSSPYKLAITLAAKRYLHNKTYIFNVYYQYTVANINIAQIRRKKHSSTFERGWIRGSNSTNFMFLILLDTITLSKAVD